MRRVGLRLRLVAATAAAVLLTVLVSSWFAGRAVRESFSEYARAEAEAQAEDLSIYLEAWLNSTGGIEDPGASLAALFDAASDEIDWWSNLLDCDPEEGERWVRWTSILAEELGIEEAGFFGGWFGADFEDICEEPDCSVDELVAALMREETRWAEEAGRDGAVDDLAETLADAGDFVSYFLGFGEGFADFGMSDHGFGEGFADFGMPDHGFGGHAFSVHPDAEEGFPWFSGPWGAHGGGHPFFGPFDPHEGGAPWPAPPMPTGPAWGAGHFPSGLEDEWDYGDDEWFLDTLVEEARILAVSPGGEVLYDTGEEAVGDSLPASLEGLGRPVRDWRTGEEVCRVIVAAGEGHFEGEASAFLGRVQNGLWKGALLTLALALGLAALFARRVVAPMQALTAAARRLAAGESTGRLPVESEDEVGAMSDSFNHMLDALDDQEAIRRRMVADLAHELNTPLSVLQLELAGLQAGMQTPDEAAQRIEGELEVLRRLAQDVALLAEVDRGNLAFRPEPTDLDALCREAVERWGGRAEAAGVRLAYAGLDDLPDVRADGLRMAQVLGNLIDNAVRHTPRGGSVELTVDRAEGEVLVSVRDTGEGIPPDQLERVFERFHRVDADRGRGRGGSGLGLAIVADLIRRHGGRVWAEAPAGGGARVRFSLPLGA